MIFLGLRYFLQDEIPFVELSWVYLLVESVLHPALIQPSMVHGSQSLTFYEVQLIKACLGPLHLFQP